MEKKDYKAIAACDCSIRKEDRQGDTWLLILDLSEVEGALCVIDEEGETDIREVIPSPGRAVFFSRLAERLGRNGNDTYALWRGQQRDANQKLKAYIQNSERNYPAITEAGVTLNCSELVEMFEQDKSRIMDLQRITEDVLCRNGVDQETMRILLSGQAAAFAPAEFTVRAFYNPDAPWLADDRFVQLDEGIDPAKLVQKGEQILQERGNRPFGHEIGVVCLANIGSEKNMPEHVIIIAEKDQQVKKMEESEYVEEMFLTDRTQMMLSIDGKRVLYSLRDEGVYEGIYRIGFRLNKTKPEICLQRADNPVDQEYIPIKI